MKRLILTSVLAVAACAALSAQNWYSARFERAGRGPGVTATLEAADEAAFTAKGKALLGSLWGFAANAVTVAPNSLQRASDGYRNAYTTYSPDGTLFHDCYAMNYDTGELIQFILRSVRVGTEGTAEHVAWRAWQFAVRAMWPAANPDRVHLAAYSARQSPPPGVTVAAAPAPAAEPARQEPEVPAPTVTAGNWYEVRAWYRNREAEKYTFRLEAVGLYDLAAKAKALIRNIFFCSYADVVVETEAAYRTRNPYGSSYQHPADGSVWYDVYLLYAPTREGVQLILRAADASIEGDAHPDYRAWLYARDVIWTQHRADLPNEGITVVPFVPRPVSGDPVLTAPADVAVVEEPGGVLLTWSSVNGATGYIVDYVRTIPAGGTPASLEEPGTRIQIPLDAEAVWSFTVKARRNAETGPASAAVRAQPRPPRPAPVALTAPRNVRVAAGPGSLTVRWDAVPGATRYVVFAMTGRSERQAVTAENTCVVTGLSPSLEYSVWVRIVDGPNNLDSAPVTGRPLVPFETPAAPRVTAAVSRLIVSWPALPGATEYWVKVETDGASGRSETAATLRASGDQTSLIFQPATPGKAYRVSLQARAGAYLSAYGPAARGVPLETSPVPNPFLRQAKPALNLPGTGTGMATLARQSWSVTVRIVYKTGTQEDKAFTVTAASEAAAKEEAVDEAKKYVGGKATTSITAVKAVKK